jgi:hypothetical protein
MKIIIIDYGAGNVQSVSNAIKEIEGQLYELEFGNDTIGKALMSGNVVNLTYMITNKIEGNGARLFTYTGSTLLGGVVAITTTTPAVGGADIESIDSVRYNAPRSYASQNRAVTVEDYKSIIFRLYPEAKTVNAWVEKTIFLLHTVEFIYQFNQHQQQF